MHDEKLSIEVTKRMFSHGITKTQLAKEIGRGRRTVWLWLAREMNQERHEALMMALDRIEKRKAE